MQINPKEVSVTTQSPALRYDDQEGCYLWMKGERHQISKDFVTTEFDCPCKNAGCQEQRISAAHIEKLQEVRNEVGAIRSTAGIAALYIRRSSDSVGMRLPRAFQPIS
jgi:hypothetical protein